MKKIFSNKKIIYLVLIVVLVLIGGSSFISGYYLAQNKSNETIHKERIKTKEALEELQKLVEQNLKETKSQPKKHIKKKTMLYLKL